MSVCHVCGVSAANFSRKCLFEDHIKSHTGQTFVCPSCGKSFSQYYSFLKHQSMFHSTITYACEECGKQFTNNINLKRHEQIHLKSCDHICDICSKSFLRIDALKRHNCSSIAKKLCCEFCSKKFGRKDSLDRHIRVYHMSKEFICDYCLTSFDNEHKYKAHLKKNHQPKSLSCKYCNKKFKSEDTLKTHKEVSHPESVIKITWMMNGEEVNCNNNNNSSSNENKNLITIPKLTVNNAKSFISTIVMELVESVIKRVKCNLCEKSYTNKSHLTRHMKSCHSNKPTCEICVKPFSYKHTLDRHMQMVHKVEKLEKEVSKVTLWRRGKKAVQVAESIHGNNLKVVEHMMKDVMENNKKPAGKAINKILVGVKKMSAKRSHEISSVVMGSKNKARKLMTAFKNVAEDTANNNEYGIGVTNPFQSQRQMKKVENEFTKSVSKDKFHVRKLNLYLKKNGKLSDTVGQSPAVTVKNFKEKVVELKWYMTNLVIMNFQRMNPLS